MSDNFTKLHALFEQAMMDNAWDETLKAFKVLSHDGIKGTDKFQSEERCQLFQSIVEKRKEGVPLEYILGMGQFYGHRFCCGKGALIPREETELLVDTVLNRIRPIQKGRPLTLVDMGTGCGSIAVSIALHTENACLYASDLTADTINVARKNIAAYSLEKRITLFKGDLFAPFSGKGLEEKVDMVVCNPPYIPSTSLKKAAAHLIDHEPVEAFNGGEFGIGFLRRLINDSPVFLKPGGLLLFEIGLGQEKLVSRIIKSQDAYGAMEFVDDGTNVRVICAQKKG